MPIPLSIQLYERGALGRPSTTALPELRERIDSYTHTITDQFGFESMSVPFTCGLDEALEWLTNGLMRSVVVVDPDARTVWEGYLHTIRATIGQKTIVLSLDGMANRVTCLYTTTYGIAGTTSATSSAASQALYGVRDRIVSLQGDTSTAAANKATVILADLAFPKSREATQAMTGDLGSVQLTLDFEGWYGTLGWVTTSRSSTTNTAISTQIAALINTSSPGIGATNNFLSTETRNIKVISNTATEKIEAGTTYRDKIEGLLKQGTGVLPVTWGVYDDRQFYAVTWAGATPTTITYQEMVGTSDVYDSVGNIVPPWLVRPNAMAQVVELLDVGPVSGTVDAAARKYVGRVTCSISGTAIGCTLEPSDIDTVDARLAAMR